MKHFLNSICVALVLAFAALLLGGCRTAGNGTFEKTKWGMTAAEVNNTTSRTLITNDDGSVKAEDAGEVDFIPQNEGTAEAIVYYFNKTGGLQQVTVTAKPAFGGDVEKLSDFVTKTFNSRFKTKGEANKSTTVWQVKNSKITLWQQSDSLLICFEENG